MDVDTNAGGSVWAARPRSGQGASIRFVPRELRIRVMLNTRYKKLTGMHAGHSYTVVAPYSEIENPMQWMLHCEADADEKQIVAENELNDRKLWQPLT
jgi:hypothetical protein